MNNDQILDFFYRFSLAAVPMFLGIICHEVAHGWAAYRQGDPTAKRLGRLTMNPIKHIDPMGLAVFALTALTSWFVIGWAKPVPVQPHYFRNRRRGMMIVAIAGPLTNFMLALGFAFICKVIQVTASPLTELSTVTVFIFESAKYGIFINLMLAVFNLMPIPPMDGSHIIAGLLPRDIAARYEKIGKYGMLIVIVLLASGFLSPVLRPFLNGAFSVISAIVGLNS